jgi:hypothetical protein
VLFKEPRTLKERQSIATRCCSELKLTMPCVVDAIDNRVGEAYVAWPERLYVVDQSGKIAYAGGQGPRDYKPQELERWLRDHLPASNSPGP